MPLVRSLFAAALLVPAHAAAFDPSTWTDDPALFADLSVQDFQAFTPTWVGSGYAEENPLVVDDLAYWGGVEITNNFCIPGMDSGGVCGGANVYMASSGSLHIGPLAPVDRIAFDFGSQSHELFIDIELSDGSVYTFVLQSTTMGEWGPAPVRGFFGYGTGDAALTIEHVHIYWADSGIDNVRYGVAMATGACDDLESAIRDLGLARGLENSLLAKVEAADRMLDRGNITAGIQILQALMQEIGAQRGKAIAASDADALLACIAERIADLTR